MKHEQIAAQHVHGAEVLRRRGAGVDVINFEPSPTSASGRWRDPGRPSRHLDRLLDIRSRGRYVRVRAPPAGLLAKVGRTGDIGIRPPEHGFG